MDGSAQIIAVLAGLLCGLSVSTEVFAYIARLDGALGAPWYRHGFLAFYPPWDIVAWAWQWAGRVPTAFKWPLIAGLVVAVLTTIKTWPRVTTHAQPQAHWATWAELKKAELLSRTGVVVGKLGKHILRYGGVGHILVVAGTQSGKTVSIVLPTLLDEEPGRARSMIIHDPKESLYPKSARYRSKLGKVVRLAPLCPETDFLNPWDPVRLGTDDEFRDVELIATYLTNPEGKASRDDVTEHFQELLNQFFCGVFLYGLHTGIATTGREFNDLVNCTAWKDLLTVMAAHDHPEVQRAAMIASRPGDKELGALQTTAARALRIFSDPRIAHMTSTSSFRMEELREADQPCTVYLSVPFGDQQRLRPLTRLLLRQMLDHCTSKLSGWKHPLLAMIEEFPSLGRFEPISDGLNFAAEFGLQYCLITPSMEELINTYGAHHNFLAGCRVQAIFGLSDEGTARKFSGRVGTRERKQQRITTQKGGRQSSTEDVREEPLLNTTGVLQLEEHEVLIMAGRYQRIVSQARYYTSALWNPRSVLPIPPSSVVTTTKPK